MDENEILELEELFKSKLASGENSHIRLGIADELKNECNDIIDRMVDKVDAASKFNGVDSY